MNQLIFNEESMLDNNVFKYEQRLSTTAARYVEGGAVLATFYNLNNEATTSDRGLNDIEQLLGSNSPLRYDKIENFPLYGFDPTTPENVDDREIEDIAITGECLVLPSTITPAQYSFFVVNHIHMVHLFQVVEVKYDNMRAEGYYQIRYRLESTSKESIRDIEHQTVNRFRCDLNAIGTTKNPIFKLEDYVRRTKIVKMMNEMISLYRGMFYNDRHNCFLYHDSQTGTRWFDLCANEFMARNSLQNIENSSSIVMLHTKLEDPSFLFNYNRSIYHWIETDAPKRFLKKFKFRFIDGISYVDSSFYKWNEEDIKIALPAPDECIAEMCYSFFTDSQLDLFDDTKCCKGAVMQYDELLRKYINGTLFSIEDIPLEIIDSLINSPSSEFMYFYTPIIIYIIKKILKGCI